MSLLSELKTIMGTSGINLPCEIGVYTNAPAPSQYVVFEPLSDSFQCADDIPITEVQSVRISLYSDISYTAMAVSIAKAIITAGITITDRRYIGHEDETGYHHYVIDVEKNYLWEE